MADDFWGHSDNRRAVVLQVTVVGAEGDRYIVHVNGQDVQVHATDEFEAIAEARARLARVAGKD